MEPFSLQYQRDNDGFIECWDDDDDLQCYDDIQLRTASSATSVTNSSIRRSGHRDSMSSRLSARSDLDSNKGGDEDWQVHLIDGEEHLSEEAIASAKNAGIPLPSNVPGSALVGGTIKRLGRKKAKHDFVDDWSEDMEFPGFDGMLKPKFQEESFPENIRQVSSSAGSPVKSPGSPFWSDDDISTRLQSTVAKLNETQSQDNDFDGSQDVHTIKLAKSHSPRRNCVRSNHQQESTKAIENFDDDFELPADDFHLRFSSQEEIPRNSSPNPAEFDVEMSEGSIGVRFGGTTRDHRSNPSSSVSIVSPGASSYLTGESDDEGLDGLIIPDGPLEFETSLKKFHEPKSSDANRLAPLSLAKEQPSTDDFFRGLDVEHCNTFSPGRLSVNPNVKCKKEHTESPSRRSATSLTFTNTASTPKTRIPRLSAPDHPHSTHLETVSESGAPLSKYRNQLSRIGAHASQTPMPGLSSPKTLSASPAPLAPGRRTASSRTLKDASAEKRISTGKQSLSTKRSMPTIRNTLQASVTSSSHGSSVRRDGVNRSYAYSSRPKTPVDRLINDTRAAGRKSQAPFIPPGASENQSHHASVKNYKHSRRNNSDGSNGTMDSQGLLSPLLRPGRRDILGDNNIESNLEAIVTAAKRPLTRPTRRRNFGDGTELASFDDLPTSSSTESKFVKQPSGRGIPRSLRSRLSRTQPIHSSQDTSTAQQIEPRARKPHTFTPRFAQDTNASRNAREQRIASISFGTRSREANPLASLNSNWNSPNTSRIPSNSAFIKSKKSNHSTISGSKPQLIKPMGAGVQEPKCVNGMRYDPTSFTWEGNEKSVQEFETASPKSPRPAPALITNVGAMQNVQVVGEMVFDPQRMCWLKLASPRPGANGFMTVQDEDDIFAGLGDLEEATETAGVRAIGACDDFGPSGSGDDRSCGGSSDEWPMTEEFDVGPEFIRRQRAEEEKWRRKVDKWVNFNRGGLGDGWRWAIRDIVGLGGTLGSQSRRFG